MPPAQNKNEMRCRMAINQNESPYKGSGQITREQFLFYEMRTTAKLMEEGLDDNVVTETLRALLSADLLIIGGTSLVVYPAASFISYYRGKDIVLINKSSTGYDNEASLVINESIGEILKEAVLDKF